MRAHLITISILAAVVLVVAIMTLAVHLFGMIGLGIILGGAILFWFYMMLHSVVSGNHYDSP